ncbi:hypothetical protein Tco_1509603 [Tanacetum coccineum]
MLAKALAHYFEAKLLLLDVNDFSLKVQSKYGASSKENSKQETKGGTLLRQSSASNFGSRGSEAFSNPPNLRRNAFSSANIDELASKCTPPNPEALYVDELENLLDDFMLSLNTEIDDGSIEERNKYVDEIDWNLFHHMLRYAYAKLKESRGAIQPAQKVFVITSIRGACDYDSASDELVASVPLMCIIQELGGKINRHKLRKQCIAEQGSIITETMKGDAWQVVRRLGGGNSDW